MPRLHHTVTVNRATAGAVDEYNNPSQTFAAIATTQALIQPKTGTELAAVGEGGPVRGRYRVFMRPTDIAEADHLVHEDEVYEVTFVADAGGAGHHLELDAEKVWP